MLKRLRARPDEPKRIRIAGIRFTPEERWQVAKQAASSRMSVSEFIRARSLNGRIDVIQTDVQASPATLIGLRRIATNLKQIAIELRQREISVPQSVVSAAELIEDFVLQQIMADDPELATNEFNEQSKYPRSTQINVRFTDDEREQLQALASRTNLSVTCYLRVQALRGSVTITEPMRDIAASVMLYLNELGKLLNRLAHRLNAGGDTPPELEQISQRIQHIVMKHIHVEHIIHGASPGDGR